MSPSLLLPLRLEWMRLRASPRLVLRWGSPRQEKLLLLRKGFLAFHLRSFRWPKCKERYEFHDGFWWFNDGLVITVEFHPGFMVFGTAGDAFLDGGRVTLKLVWSRDYSFSIFPQDLSCSMEVPSRMLSGSKSVLGEGKLTPFLQCWGRKCSWYLNYNKIYLLN